MKKDQAPAHQQSEMVSLNKELFSLEAGNLSVEELDQRLEMAIAVLAGDFTCATFICGSFDSCGAFACGTFKFAEMP